MQKPKQTSCPKHKNFLKDSSQKQPSNNSYYIASIPIFKFPHLIIPSLFAIHSRANTIIIILPSKLLYYILEFIRTITSNNGPIFFCKGQEEATLDLACLQPQPSLPHQDLLLKQEVSRELRQGDRSIAQEDLLPFLFLGEGVESGPCQYQHGQAVLLIRESTTVKLQERG